VQHFLLENITEEEGFVGSGDFAPVRHSELLLEFANTCGMKRDEVLNAQVKGELLPETLGLQSWCAVQSTKPFVEALSGLLIGLESQVPRIYILPADAKCELDVRKKGMKPHPRDAPPSEPVLL
jgi:pyrroloquinoline-quinone synthase